MKAALLFVAALAGPASAFAPPLAPPPPSSRVSTTSQHAPTSKVDASAAVASSSSLPLLPRNPRRRATLASLKAEPAATETSTTAASQQTPAPLPSDWRGRVLDALSAIVDPDLDADIVSLGFVQNLRIDEETRVVSLDLELTTPACPVKDAFVAQCQDVIDEFDFTSDARPAEVTITSRESEAPTGAPYGMAQVGAVIAVSSCKGGVGKSTTAVNLAYALHGLGARVGIFDADVYGPSLPTMVTPEDDAVRFVGRQVAPLERDGVSLMSFGYVNDGSAIMRGPMVTQLLDQFLSLTYWGPIDYLVMDMPPGTGDIQLTLSQKLNITAAVIVTTPQELSFVDVERGVEMFDTVNVPCVAVVENMAYLETRKESRAKVEIDEPSLREKFLDALRKDGAVGGDSDDASDVIDNLVDIVRRNVQEANGDDGSERSTGGEGDDGVERVRIFGPGHKRRLSEQWGIEHQFSVPLMGQIARNGDSGTPFIVENPDSPQAEVYRQLAKSVVSEVAKTKHGRGKGGVPNIVYDQERHIIQVTDVGRGDEREGRGEGPASAIPPAELRRACRCAECVEELTGEQILDPASIPESVKPTAMSPTGNYALSVDWSDGHRSLYPYRQIRSMIEEAAVEV